MLGEVAEVLGHLGRTGRAVHADDVGPHRLERGECGPDLGPDEHAARRLDRDLHHDRDRVREPGAAHRPAGAVDRGLRLQEVVDGLDEQHVDATRDEPVDLELVVVAQRRVLDLTERREPGTGSDRADDEPGPAVGGVTRSHLARQCGRVAVHLEGLIGEPVLVQHQRERAEGCGLDPVDAGPEELVVHLGDEVGSGLDEVLVAALERFATEVVGAEILALHPGAEGAVEDEDALVERIEERMHGPAADGRSDSPGVCHQTRLRGRNEPPLHDSRERRRRLPLE